MLKPEELTVVDEIGLLLRTIEILTKEKCKTTASCAECRFNKGLCKIKRIAENAVLEQFYMRYQDNEQLSDKHTEKFEEWIKELDDTLKSLKVSQ